MAAGVRRVAVLSPGDMGGGTGAVLHRQGVQISTTLDGRSELTRTIAADAGFADLPLDELVQTVDLVMSIVVPSEAVGVAERVAAAMQRTGATPVYADGNAISPQTVERVAEIITNAGGSVVDVGIVGSPPDKSSDTTFYCSGLHTAAFEVLGEHGLRVRRVGDRIGQASGLKMVYAASTKGTTALWTELLVAARALGLDEPLLAEFGPDHPTANQQFRVIPRMPHRAGRWIGEMEEIAATFAELGMTPKILQGAADMYRLVDATSLGRLTSRDAHPPLDEVLNTLAWHLDRGQRAE